MTEELLTPDRRPGFKLNLKQRLPNFWTSSDLPSPFLTPSSTPTTPTSEYPSRSPSHSRTMVALSTTSTRESPTLKSALKKSRTANSDQPEYFNNSSTSTLKDEESVDTAHSYARRVGFDTFDSGAVLEETNSPTGGGTGVNYSFSISGKCASYARQKTTRTFLIGTDLNEYSRHALDWALHNLIEANDEVVIVRVMEEEDKDKPDELDEAKSDAQKLLDNTMEQSRDTPISVSVEFAIGPVEETLNRMIEMYKPDSLIVGTRGLPDKLWKSAFMGSVSKYCVSKSPVPVVVVRPKDKVKEALDRRGERRSYLNLLDAPSTQTGVTSNLRPASIDRTTTRDDSSNCKKKSKDKELKKTKTVG